jgi:prefoldin subunit 5
MAIHDEVMPEMDRIYRLQKELTQVIDSLETAGGSSSIPVDSLKTLSAELKEADEAMMNWMRSNDFQFEGMEQEEIMQELQSEKENIIVVRDKMMNSIQQAEEVLQEFEHP